MKSQPGINSQTQAKSSFETMTGQHVLLRKRKNCQLHNMVITRVQLASIVLRISVWQKNESKSLTKERIEIPLGSWPTYYSLSLEFTVRDGWVKVSDSQSFWRGKVLFRNLRFTRANGRYRFFENGKAKEQKFAPLSQAECSKVKEDIGLDVKALKTWMPKV